MSGTSTAQRTKEPTASPKEVLAELLLARAQAGAGISERYRADEATRLSTALEPFMSADQRQAVAARMENVHKALVRSMTSAMQRSVDNHDQIGTDIANAVSDFALARDQIVSAVVGEDDTRQAYWSDSEVGILVELTFDKMLDEARAEIKEGEQLPMEKQHISGCLDSLYALFNNTDDSADDTSAERDTRTRVRRASVRRNIAVVDRLGRDKANLARRLLDKLQGAWESLTSAEAWTMTKKLAGFVTALLLLGGAYWTIRNTILPDRALRATQAYISAARGEVDAAYAMLDTAESSVLAADAIVRDTTAEMIDRGNILSQTLAAPPGLQGTGFDYYRTLMTDFIGRARSAMDQLNLDATSTEGKRKLQALFEKDVKDVNVLPEGAFQTIEKWAAELRDATTMDEVKQVALQYDNNALALTGVRLSELPNADSIYRKHLSLGIASIAGTKGKLAELSETLDRATEALATASTQAQRVRSSTPVMTAIARTISEKIGAGEGGAAFLAFTLLQQATAAEAVFGTFVVDFAAGVGAGSVAQIGAAFATLGANLIVGYLNGQLTGLLTLLLGGTVEASTAWLERHLLFWENSLGATGSGDGAMRRVFASMRFVISGSRATISTLRSAQTMVSLTRGAIQMGLVFATMLFGVAVSLLQIGVVATSAAALVAVGVTTYALFCSSMAPLMSSMVAPVLHHLDHWGQWYKWIIIVFMSIWTMRASFTAGSWRNEGKSWFGFLQSTTPSWTTVKESASEPALTAVMTAKDTLATHLSVIGPEVVTTQHLLGVSRVIAAGVELKSP